MRTHKAQVFGLIFCLFCWPSLAAEGGGADAGAESDLSGSETREYREKSAKLAGLEAKIKDLDTELAQLVELKKREKKPERVRQMMDDLVVKTKERNTLAAEHRRLKSHLLYRFPNLGATIHRKYGTHEEASVEQLEKARGLADLLDETKILIQKKYAPILKETKESEDEVLPLPQEPEKKPLRLVK